MDGDHDQDAKHSDTNTDSGSDTTPTQHFPLSSPSVAHTSSTTADNGQRVHPHPAPVQTHTDYAKAIARSTWILISTLYSIAAYLLWFGVFLLPLRFLAPALYWRMEAQIFRFLQSPVVHWMMTAGYTVEEVGDDISALENDESLILPNHQSTGDVPTIMMSLMNKPSACGRVLWIISSTFRFTHFGICSMLRGDFFISAGKQRENQLRNLSKHVDDVYSRHYRKWMILFPEGGFFRKKKAKSQSYAKKMGYPVLNYVALPRTGALQTIIELMSPNKEKPELLENGLKYRPLKWVVDMTIGYPGQKPLDFFNVTFANRPPCKTTIHYRIYSASDVPNDSDALMKWLFKRYEEKDQLLAEFYETGSFPPQSQGDKPLEKRAVEVDSDWLNAIHAFFLVSLAMQVYMFYRLYHLLMLYAL